MVVCLIIQLVLSPCVIAKQVNLGNKILFNFILFHDDECFGPRHEEGWMMKIDQNGSFKTMVRMVPPDLADEDLK